MKLDPRLTKIGGNTMESNKPILTITPDHKGVFLRNGEYASISSVEPQDILALIQIIAQDPDSTLTECTKDNDIVDLIEKTIYEKLYEKLRDLQINRTQYLEGIDKEYEEFSRKMGIES